MPGGEHNWDCKIRAEVTTGVSRLGETAMGNQADPKIEEIV